MIVWVASYPRSGNTFLRIVLNRLYAIRTSVAYDVDGVAERVGGALIGFEERPASYAALRASDQTYFIKTHRQRDADIDVADPAICLVRDGRDALVSWARMNSEADPSQFEPQLRAMIARRGARGTGGWGDNVLSWLRPPAAHRVVLRYGDLVADPRRVVQGALAIVAPAVRPAHGAEVPSFAELREVDDRFFRRGESGSHRDELPDEIQALFWARPENAAAMELLAGLEDHQGR